MCFEKEHHGPGPKKTKSLEAKNGSVQSLLNSPHSECDKYTNHLHNNFVSCGNGMVMVNMERYRSHELRVAIYITKIRARKFHVKYMRLTFSRQKYLYGKRHKKFSHKN